MISALSSVSAVIFDQDGLMFDTVRISAGAWNLAGRELGVEVREDFLKTIRGRNYRDAVPLFREEFSGKCDYEQLWRRKQEIYAVLLKERDLPVKPGLRELLSWLSGHRIPKAVATASTLTYTRTNLERTGLLSCFDAVITGDKVTHAKPDPELFLKAADALGQKPEVCLVLEDSINGVRAGIAGGFLTIMVPDFAQPDEELKNRATAVCPSLFEVLSLLREAKR